MLKKIFFLILISFTALSLYSEDFLYDIYKSENFSELEKGKTKITIKTQSPKVKVYLNEEFYGYTPLEISDLIPGFYFIELKKEGCKKIRTAIQVKDAVSDFYYFELKPAEGTVSFSGLPEGAVLSIDGVKSEKTEGIILSQGKHYYTARKFGLENMWGNFTVQGEGQSEGEAAPDLTISLEPREKQLGIKKFKSVKKCYSKKSTDFQKIGFNFKISKNAFCKIQVFNQYGIELYSEEFGGNFTEENQAVEISRKAFSEGLTEGTYTAKLSARPLSESENLSDNSACDECSFSVK